MKVLRAIVADSASCNGGRKGVLQYLGSRGTRTEGVGEGGPVY